jgi:hypothetical protein
MQDLVFDDFMADPDCFFGDWEWEANHQPKQSDVPNCAPNQLVSPADSQPITEHQGASAVTVRPPPLVLEWRKYRPSHWPLSTQSLWVTVLRGDTLFCDQALVRLSQQATVDNPWNLGSESVQRVCDLHKYYQNKSLDRSMRYVCLRSARLALTSSTASGSSPSNRWSYM